MGTIRKRYGATLRRSAVAHAALIGVAALCAALAVAGPAQARDATPGVDLDAADPTSPALESEREARRAAALETRRANAGVRAASDPVVASLARARRRDAITSEEANRYYDIYRNGRSLLRRLSGARRNELGYVIGVVRTVARRGELFSHRMPAAFETIRRNRQFWNERAFPSSGSRHTFRGSRIIWQYYPGRGVQIQPLANFGAVNGLWSRFNESGRRAAEEHLDQLLELASNRGGSLTWEYWFSFGGGRPPWVSSIAQGTAVQALGRVGRSVKREDFHRAGARALRLFRMRTPRGVRVPLTTGTDWWAIYSFSPGLRVLNAHVQAANGLNDFRAHTNSSLAAALFRRGELATHRRIRQFDTGAWSKYAHPGIEATLEYHTLNRDLVKGLCRRAERRSICLRGDRFSAYMDRTPRILSYGAGPARAGRSTSVRFVLDKVSHVRVLVGRRGSIAREIAGQRYRGRHRIAFTAPRRPGSYIVRIITRDLAGNESRRDRRLRVHRPV